MTLLQQRATDLRYLICLQNLIRTFEVRWSLSKSIFHFLAVLISASYVGFILVIEYWSELVESFDWGSGK